MTSSGGQKKDSGQLFEIFIFDKFFRRILESYCHKRSTNFERFRRKTMSNKAEIAQKLKNTLILGGYDVIRGPKKGLGSIF